MQKDTTAALDGIEAQTGPNPGAALIILHGLGADGNDFVPLAQELDLAEVGDVRFVFPHAPKRPVTINQGFVTRAWYDILGFGTNVPQDEAGLRASMQTVQMLIGREMERGIPPGRIVLAGFSQGCAMALMTGLRHPDRLGGIVAMSGYLPLAMHTAVERSPANISTPIFMAHGREDEIVRMSRGEASRDMLRMMGHQVEWHDYPMGHSVCAEEIQALNAWLLKVLG